MNKTSFSEKCNILGDLWLYYREDAKNNDAWNEFFIVNDISLPLAYMIAKDIALVSGDGSAEEFIDETWNSFCEYINIDPEGWYKDLGEAFAASNNPPLNNE
jgi:hypothetical protein